jgi:PAS domain S-box-containing protein
MLVFLPDSESWAISVEMDYKVRSGLGSRMRRSMSNNQSNSRQALADPAQLQTTLNVIPAYAWYAASSGGLTFVNKRTADYLGLPQDHSLRCGIDTGAAWDAHIPFLHPDDHDETRKVWSTCLRTGRAGEVSFRVRNAQGGYRWFLSRAEPLRASDGTLLQWVGVNLDIEELKSAEQAVRESESRLREIIETIPALVWRAGSDGHIDYVSKRLLEYLGSPLEEIIGWGWMDKVHPDDIAFKVQTWLRNLEAATSHAANCRFRGADGAYRWFNVRGEPLHDTEGRVQNWYGVLIDVDDQKKAEEASRDSELRLREIIDTVPSMVWSASPDGEPTHLNQRVLDYSGLRLENFLNLGWEAFIHPEDFPETAKAFFHAIQTGESYEVAHRLRRADGQYRWHHARGEPLRDRQQRIVQWYGLAVDIEDAKKAENELRATQALLARASQAATVAELSASIAHEINQPLAGIVASAQTCRTWLSGDNPNLPRAQAAIERIIRDGNAAADIIRRIRALFKQTAPTKTPMNINAVIEEVGRLAQHELSRRGVSLELELAHALPVVSVDRIQIQQVLVNLIRNGAEAMEDANSESKRLIVRSHCTDGCVVLEVCDFGPGLTHPDKAFEPFYSTKQDGLGVGLAISRSIVHAHGGVLRVRDNEPQGAAFWLTLPLWSEAPA